MSFLKTLAKVMPPPVEPIKMLNRGSWQSAEAALGIKLPEDYKEFVTTYGEGAVDNFLWVLNPFSQNENLNLVKQAKVRLDAQREFSEKSGIKNPYALYPDAKGLFPWGITDNGDVLYWLCNGSSLTWAIVVCDSRSSRWQEFQLSTGEFLTKLLTRELVVDIFPRDFPSESPEFIPLW